MTPFTVRWPQAPREDKDFLKSECLPELGACGGQALIASGFGDMVEKMIAPPSQGTTWRQCILRPQDGDPVNLLLH